MTERVTWIVGALIVAGLSIGGVYLLINPGQDDDVTLAVTVPIDQMAYDSR
jgi:hypothetical protein